jgi:amphi-Trp domain-containing protein
MKTTHEEFRHESLEDSESLARYLRAITDGFTKGSLSISNRAASIALEPHGLVHLEVRARKTRESVQLAVELSWKPDAAREADAGALSISSADS